MRAFQTSQSRQATTTQARGSGQANHGLIQPKQDRAATALADFQPKLRIGAPGGRYEGEADRAAAKVQRGEAVGFVSRIGSGGLGAQRLEANASDTQVEGEEDLQTKAFERQLPEENHEPVQRRSTDSQVHVRRVAAQEAMAARGTGSPIPAATRGAMESSFGVDLSTVRVQKDGRANEAARHLGARAFAKGREIFLSEGESDRDLNLMAHETTHVLQQDAIDRNASPDPAPTAQSSSLTGDPLSQTAALSTGSPGSTTAAGVAAMGGGQVAPVEAKITDAVSREAVQKGAPPPRKTKGAQGAKTASKGADPKTAEKQPTPDKASDHAAAVKAARLIRERKEKQQVITTLGKAQVAAMRQQGVAAVPSHAVNAAKHAAVSASAAAPSPADESLALGKADQVDTMNAQKAGKVDKKSFLDVVKTKLRKMDMPANPDEMSKFKSKGGASGLGSDLKQEVGKQKANAATAIESTAQKTPTPVEARVSSNLPSQPPAAAPVDMAAKQAAPEPLAGVEVTLEPGRDEVEAKLAKENLTKARLEKANDPRFTAAQTSRVEVHTQADTLPKQFRRQERATLAKDRKAMQQNEHAANTGMLSSRLQGNQKVTQQQQQQMAEEYKKRQKITKDLDKIYTDVKTVVEAKLAALDTTVDKLFTDAESDASSAFEDYVDTRFLIWKANRYSGVGGSTTWFVDLFRDINAFPAVKKIYQEGQDLYFSILDRRIDVIGREVDQTLSTCKKIIKNGAQAVKDYLGNLDKDMRELAKDSALAVMGRFADLRDTVDAKRDALADKVAQRYQASRKKLDARIEEIKAANRSVVLKAVNKAKEVLAAIANFRTRIASALRKAAGVIEKIIDDPIGFLGNLIDAVKQGFKQFNKNFTKHLKAGLFGWLFGTFAAKGIQLPSDFSFKSIMGFLFQLLGLTYDRLRSKAVRLVGERNVAIVEQVGTYLKDLFTKGPLALWEQIKTDVGNLKDTIMNGIRDWLVTQIIEAAITKLLSMFNPVGAIVQAVLAIYNLVMFFIERIDQIIQLVNTIINSLGVIVAGKIQAAADKVEQAMGQMVPLIIAFLARLLGIGGVAGRVMKIIRRVQRKVDRAIDKLLKKIVTKIKGMLKKGKAAYGKAQGKVKHAVGKIFKWWRLKSPFKVGGEKHHVKFQGKGRNSKLVVASTPKTMEQYFENLNTTGWASEKLEKLAAAKAKAKEIDALKKVLTEDSQNEKNGEDIAKTKKKGQEISTKMGELATLLVALDSGNNVPASEIELTPGGPYGEDGLEAEAWLSDQPSKKYTGSQPTQQSRLWNKVKQRKNEYVRGHLLNHHLYGPGIKKNLTPITRSLNAEMESKVESGAKNSILGNKIPVYYQVKADYAGAKHLDPPAEQGFIPEEKLLIAGFQFRLYSLVQKRGDGRKWSHWEKGGKLDYDKYHPHKLEYLNKAAGGKSLERVNLYKQKWRAVVTEATLKQELQEVTGIGEKRATFITETQFKSWKDMGARHDPDTGRRQVPNYILEALQQYRNAKRQRMYFMRGKTILR